MAAQRVLMEWPNLPSCKLGKKVQGRRAPVLRSPKAKVFSTACYGTE